MDRREERGVLAAATGRALAMLSILDRPHQVDEIHAVARAVRHELESMAALVGEHQPPDLPGLAAPVGEQLPLM